jgi:hypothetical protein
MTSCNYKKDCKENAGVVNKPSHPTWDQRIKYANYGVYNYQLLKDIAIDAANSFKNSVKPVRQEVVDAVWDFYNQEEIALT